MIKYSQLPQHMQEGAQLYVERGRLGGSFLRAVLSNDLTGAFFAADPINKVMLSVWADWLINDAPRECWGSREMVNWWCEQGGLEGLKEG